MMDKENIYEVIRQVKDKISFNQASHNDSIPINVQNDIRVFLTLTSYLEDYSDDPIVSMFREEIIQDVFTLSKILEVELPLHSISKDISDNFTNFKSKRKPIEYKTQKIDDKNSLTISLPEGA